MNKTTNTYSTNGAFVIASICRPIRYEGRGGGDGLHLVLEDQSRCIEWVPVVLSVSMQFMGDVQQPCMYQTRALAGIIKLFPARESLGSEIPAG